MRAKRKSKTIEISLKEDVVIVKIARAPASKSNNPSKKISGDFIQIS